VITQIKKHPVTAIKIVALQPLVIGGVMAAPDAGFTLVLADDSKRRWAAEKGGVPPVVGDFLVTDTEVGVTYTVCAEKFETLFEG
jgi:hypothetical protein